MFLAYVKLNDGHNMPLLGFGTSNIFIEAAYEAVKTAIEVGYRHIDTAWIYGNEQEVVGLPDVPVHPIFSRV